jgi:hypothetical protein
MTDNSAIVWDIVMHAIESGEWSIPNAEAASDVPPDSEADQDRQTQDDDAEVTGYWRRGDPPPNSANAGNQWWPGGQGGRQRGGFELFGVGGQQQFSP